MVLKVKKVTEDNKVNADYPEHKERKVKKGTKVNVV